MSSPIFVVGPPRAGARLVADLLGTASNCWSAGSGLLASFPALDPPDGSRGGRLETADCTPPVRHALRAHLQVQLARSGGTASGRIVHGSPRNSLLTPFLNAAFPNATFVYVHREPADALTEALQLWRAGTAVTYPDLPGWTEPSWSFLLVPGWQELIGRPLAEVVTEQWVRTMRVLTEDLERLPPERWCVAHHEALQRDPAAETARLTRYLQLESLDPASESLADRRLQPEDLAALRTELEPYLDRTRPLSELAADWLAGPHI